MVDRFQKNIEKEELFTPSSDRVLLAVSGGMDSVAMAHLFHQAGYEYGIAHCNFQLRGADSEADLAFVADLAGELGVSFHSASFSTEEESRRRRVGIQELARDLRYEWLEGIRQSARYAYIATAHHLDDSIETALFNWIKGTGIRGLLGIPQKNGRIIRPLLHLKKADIEQFVAESCIDYREDSSNAEDKYSRNKIRHHVIPVLRELNSGLEETMQHNFRRLREIQYWMNAGLDDLRDKVWKESERQVRIELAELRQHPYPVTPLYEWLRPYGFNATQITDLWGEQGGIPGALVTSGRYRLLRDRNCLLLEKIGQGEGQKSFVVQNTLSALSLGEDQLKLTWLNEPPREFPNNNFTAYLDADRLAFPLALRRWQPGDLFAPLGMGGRHQKVQDFFSNHKVNRFAKHKAWILVSADGEICWVAGYRISENFKIRPETKRILKLDISKLRS